MTKPQDLPLDAHTHPGGVDGHTPGDAALEQVGTHPLGTAAGVIGGAMAGAVIGIAAGPLGSVAGAVAGGVAGGLAGSGSTAGGPATGPTLPSPDEHGTAGNVGPAAKRDNNSDRAVHPDAAPDVPSLTQSAQPGRGGSERR